MGVGGMGIGLWALALGLSVVTPWAGADGDGWEKRLNAGRELQDRGQYEEAERLFRLALDEVKTLGADEPRVADVLDCLAYVAVDRSELREAEAFAKESLMVRQKALGNVIASAVARSKNDR